MSKHQINPPPHAHLRQTLPTHNKLTDMLSLVILATPPPPEGNPRMMPVAKENRLLGTRPWQSDRLAVMLRTRCSPCFVMLELKAHLLKAYARFLEEHTCNMFKHFVSLPRTAVLQSNAAISNTRYSLYFAHDNLLETEHPFIKTLLSIQFMEGHASHMSKINVLLSTGTSLITLFQLSAWPICGDRREKRQKREF